jgi:hypothetical protein
MFVVGLYYFKKVYDEKEYDNKIFGSRNALIFAFIVPLHFLTRNTSAVLWVTPLLWILFNRPWLTFTFISTTVPLFILSLVNDHRFYGFWVVPFYQFMTFNHDQFWHEGAGFFFYAATPAFLTIMTPFMVYGGYLYFKQVRANKEWPFLILIPLVYMLFYTRVGHKEIRFILPIVPLFFYFAAAALKPLKITKPTLSRLLPQSLPAYH